MAPKAARAKASVAGAAPVAAAPEPVDHSHELCVEADARVEPEAPPVGAAEADAACSACGDPGRSRSRIARQPERPGSTLVPPPGTNPSGTSTETPFSTSLKVPSPPNT